MVFGNWVLTPKLEILLKITPTPTNDLQRLQSKTLFKALISDKKCSLCHLRITSSFKIDIKLESLANTPRPVCWLTSSMFSILPGNPWQNNSVPGHSVLPYSLFLCAFYFYAKLHFFQRHCSVEKVEWMDWCLYGLLLLIDDTFSKYVFLR